MGWDKRTAIHLPSAFYDVAGFRAGKCMLQAPELSGLGDVAGKQLLHLQCHFGLDTLSWARRGATVTGLDFSTAAVHAARELARETGINNAAFVAANVYDAIGHPELEVRFPDRADIVFTSYGTIGWLPDLTGWAKVIAHYLKPGGVFFIADFHPVFWMFNDARTELVYSYFNHEVIVEKTESTYADRSTPMQVEEYSWNHPFSDIFQALLAAGIQIDAFTELPYSPVPCFSGTEQRDDGNWYFPNWKERIPIMYTIRGTKR